MSNDESGGRIDHAPAAHSPVLNPRDRHDAEAHAHVRALHRRSEAARRLPPNRTGRPGLYRCDPWIPADESSPRWVRITDSAGLTVTVRAPWSREFVSAVKELPMRGRRWDKRASVWRVSVQHVDALISDLSARGFRISDERGCAS